MPVTLTNKKRIINNTIMLYIRTFFIMALSLYTSRIVLQYLGIIDYGIYNIVGGVVTLFIIVSAALTNATQRFLSFELGKVNTTSNEINKLFNTCIVIHLFLALLFIIFAETIGLYIFNNMLNIPESRKAAAFWAFQFSMITFIISLLKSPYDACLIAHEDMKIYAYVGIIESLLKLLIVYSLIVINVDRLILYAFLLMLVALTLLIILIIYTYKYKETHLRFSYKKDLFSSIFRYSGWNMLTAMGDVGRTQGIDIALNMFFGPSVNAAKGVATQVQSAINKFVIGFQTAVNPQIIKNYSSGNSLEMIKLQILSSKFSFFLLSFFSIPVIFSCSFILQIWLKEPPKYAEYFCQLILVQTLIETLSRPIWTSINAIGKLSYVNTIVTIMYIMNVVTAYLLLHLIKVPIIVYIANILWVTLVLIFACKQLCNLVDYPYRKHILQVFIKPILSIFPLVILYLFTQQFYKINSWNSFILISIVSETVNILFIYLIGMDRSEKVKLKELIKEKIRFIRKME